ncbi:MAG TPA: hypothetical protein VMD31_02105 [Opitutaceae bacterium]|nr:hypothetical protein [Opitutaceae bacterium]
MKSLVIVSGVWNALLGAGLVLAPLAAQIGLRLPPPFWAWLSAGFLWFTAAVLILAARDLRTRAAFVYWEAFLRYLAAALLLTIGPAVLGWPAWVLGATDLAWGLSYTFGLPRALHTTHGRLLRDDLAADV